MTATAIAALIVALVNILTGLTSAPKFAPYASAVLRTWEWIRTAIRFLAVVTHADEPGTFKLPLRGLGIPYLLRRGRGTGSAILLLVLMASGPCLLAASCAWLKTEGKAVAQDAIDCAKDGVKAEVENLLPTVLVIVSGGAVDWKAQLAALETIGVESLACTLAKAAADLRATPRPPALRASPFDPAARAEDYINGRRWVFSKAR